MTEQPPIIFTHVPLNDEDEARLQSDRLLREKENTVHLWRGLLDHLDCGDCIEDFGRLALTQFQISHLTTILTGWLKNAEQSVEEHGKTFPERLRAMLESDLRD